MDEQRAREILGGLIQPDGGLYDLGHYIAWTPGEEDVRLDDRFTIEELEAIVWWVRHSPATTSAGSPAPDPRAGRSGA